MNGMPGGTILQLAAFATGCIVGAGTAISIGRRKNQPAASPSVVLPEQTRKEQQSTALTVVDARQPPGDVLKYGHPGPIADLLPRLAYAAAYDRRLRHPAWTAEHLTLASLGRLPPPSPPSSPSPSPSPGGDRSNSQFQEDASLPAPFRAKLSDYFRSGYDRGHMVPAADAKMSQAAMDETFLLSNIAPQVGAGFNRHYWAYVEDFCRRLTSSFADVFVFTIPLYLPQQSPIDGKYRVTYEVIGNPPNVSVPTHFAKVILASRPSSPSTPTIAELALGAFVLPNAAIPDEAPLTSFIVPVESVERASGLTLFSDAIKGAAKELCQSVKCDVVVRRFDDAQREVGGGGGRRGIGAPPQGARR